MNRHRSCWQPLSSWKHPSSVCSNIPSPPKSACPTKWRSIRYWMISSFPILNWGWGFGRPLPSFLHNKGQAGFSSLAIPEIRRRAYSPDNRKRLSDSNSSTSCVVWWTSVPKDCNFPIPTKWAEICRCFYLRNDWSRRYVRLHSAWNNCSNCMPRLDTLKPYCSSHPWSWEYCSPPMLRNRATLPHWYCSRTFFPCPDSSHDKQRTIRYSGMNSFRNRRWHWCCVVRSFRNICSGWLADVPYSCSAAFDSEIILRRKEADYRRASLCRRNWIGADLLHARFQVPSTLRFPYWNLCTKELPGHSTNRWTGNSNSYWLWCLTRFVWSSCSPIHLRYCSLNNGYIRHCCILNSRHILLLHRMRESPGWNCKHSLSEKFHPDYIFFCWDCPGIAIRR